jgi:predicted RNA binding protein YcfA (HicA-like mRNA interferase family)
MILVKPDAEVTLSVPDHKTLGPGLLKKLIKDAGLTIHDFTELL